MATSQQFQEIENIEGIDLNIDENIDKICEVSNSTSSNTRSIWYIIVIVSTLSFAEFWNTHPFNVSVQRIKALHDSIYVLQNRLLKADSASKIDGVTDTSKPKFELQLQKNFMDMLSHSLNDNIRTVRIPILGNAFDISDLVIFAGFAFIILLLFLKFILMRKVRNLKLALIAITKRYSNNSDEKYFNDYLNSKPEKDREKFLYSINCYRRQYHYNFLSMHEVLNTTESFDHEFSDAKATYFDKFMESARQKIFFVPFFMCLLLTINDFVNFCIKSYNIFPFHYLVSLIISLLYLAIILWLSKKCVLQSKKIERLYSDFQIANYTYKMYD